MHTMENSDQSRLELLKSQHDDTVEFIEVRAFGRFRKEALANNDAVETHQRKQEASCPAR